LTGGCREWDFLQCRRGEEVIVSVTSSRESMSSRRFQGEGFKAFARPERCRSLDLKSICPVVFYMGLPGCWPAINIIRIYTKGGGEGGGEVRLKTGAGFGFEGMLSSNRKTLEMPL